MSRNRIVLFSWTAGAVLMSMCSVHAQTTYSVVDLGTLGSRPVSYATAINNRGEVAGTAEDATTARAFLWRAGTMTDLGTLGGASSWANAVNELGWVAGSSTTSAGLRHACLWKDGVIIDLGTFGGSTSEAFGINAAGQVVGYAENVAGVRRAFLWEKGVMTDLGTLSGAASEATAINNRGQVVGASEIAEDPGMYRAVMWQDGQISKLEVGGITVGATAINERGQVVGIADYKVFRAFLWSRGEETILPGLSGSDSETASGINAQGLVAGSCFFVSNPPTQPSHNDAVVWVGGEPVLLPTLGGKSSSAAAINSRGEIAGYSMTTAGEKRAVVWK